MRDEPEMRNCFQCEVSLNMSQAKKGILLVNDYSHEEFGTAELGRDAGIRPGAPRCCAPTTRPWTATASPPTWKPPTCAPAACTARTATPTAAAPWPFPVPDRKSV